MMKNIAVEWKICGFNELLIDDLYDILHLRNKIFIVEQGDNYLDIDCKDRQALHLIGYYNQTIVAYARLFEKGTLFDDSSSFGRVLVDTAFRGKGLGVDLINKILEKLSEQLAIRISAQLYLKDFYENFGFSALGKSYLDGSIEHIDMCLGRKIGT